MKILTANHSTYPDSDGADLPSILRAQEATGIDWVTPHPGSHAERTAGPAAAFDGLSVDPRSASIFVRAKLRRRRGALAATFRKADTATGAPVKLSITGPYTLARACAIETTAYRHLYALAEDLSELLAREIDDAVAAGARLIQVDESAILDAPEDMRFLRDSLEALHAAIEPQAKMITAATGRDASAQYAQLCSLPGDFIALECRHSSDLVIIIEATGSGKPLALGLIDASRPTMDVDTLTATAQRALRRYVHDTVFLQPAAGVGGLAQGQADSLLTTLRAVQQKLGERFDTPP